MSAQVQERKRTVKRAPVLVLAAAVVVAVVVAAVAGGGGGSNGGSTAQGGDAAGLAKAKAGAHAATTRPTSIGLTTPIGKPVPTGKKIAFISCGVEACEVQGNIIKQGAS